MDVVRKIYAFVGTLLLYSWQYVAWRASAQARPCEEGRGLCRRRPLRP